MSTAPNQLQLNLNDCGCCAGLAVETPVAIDNRPGLSAIGYRVGTHAQFKASMLARLSESGLPQLRELKTRADDDFTIALLDAWAMVADVLTFYQERVANESYLRTATERASVIHLARLIGYELRPGVAASVYLAFTLEDAPGSPGAVTLDAGLKVQSIPGPGEKPQTFETVEQVAARAEWNEMRPRQTRMLRPAFGSTQIYLEGVTTSLKKGDMLLFVGEERSEQVGSERWDIRRVAEVAADADNQRTFVRWAEPLGSVVPHVDPAQKKVSVYAMRLRASLFGYNAPDWKALPVALRVGELSPQDRSFLPGAYAGRENTWAGHNFDPMKPGTNTATINLDSTYPQIVLNSWIALARPEADVPSETKATPEPTAGAPAQPSVAHVDSAQAETGVNAPTEAAAAGAPPPPPPPSPPTVHEHAYAELYRVRKVGEESKADYNITAKTTRLEISGENIEKFSPRNATVYAQSDKLPMAETPIADPVFGDQIVLEGLFEPPAPGRRIVVAGRRAHAVVGTTTSKLKLVSPDDSTLYKPLNAGDELIVLSPPASSPLPPPASAAPGSQQGATLLRWRLMDESGFEGFVDAHADKITFAASSKDDAVISEVASVRATGSEDDTHTKLFLAAALGNVFDRPTVRINANVALATHGETVSNEVLGNGDASKPYQSFVLKQSPLTYVASDAPSGGDSTLQVFANGIRWHEVPTLFNHGRRERIYITRTDEDINTHEKRTTVQFGDGETGARLPMGRENVRATYRKGIGLGGLVGAGKLSLLLTRPLGLKAVTNPQAASGAQDPQSLSDARVNSPLTVLTLDRIVSLSDYEDFARSFSGIAKALATWTWNVHTRGVFVTVAGIAGAAVADDSDLHAKLLSAIYKAGDPQVPIQIKSYHGVTFRLVADVKVDADYVAADVLAAVEAALRASFSFAARAFGQPVTLSEVISVMKNVAGVVAVDVRRLNRSDAAEALNSFLAAAAPQAGDDASQARPAELLTLDPVPLELGVMP